MSSASMNAASSGLFATAKRVTFSAPDIANMEAMRSGPNPKSWQFIAAYYACSQDDVRRHVKPVYSAPETITAAPVPFISQRAAIHQAAGRVYQLKNPFWTADKDAELRRLYLRLDMTSTQIADALGATLMATYTRAARLGIRRAGSSKYAVFNHGAGTNSEPASRSCDHHHIKES